MENKYIFRKITKEEIPQMFQLILQRMKWMDEKGIKQWNVTKYDEVYPLSYYENKRKKDQVFVLANNKTNEIVCAAVLKEKDSRWEEDNEPAVYLHNFVTKIGETGAGALFLRLAEEYAMGAGKKYFRLDSAVDNDTLEQYYESKGYCSVGTCVDGMYEGILRQKLLV